MQRRATRSKRTRTPKKNPSTGIRSSCPCMRSMKWKPSGSLTGEKPKHRVPESAVVVCIGESRNHVGDHDGRGVVASQDIAHGPKDRVIRRRRDGRSELEDLDFVIVSDDRCNLPQEVLPGLSRQDAAVHLQGGL